MAKRIFLFVLTNILVMLTISILISVIFAFTGLGAQGGTFYGMNLTQLAIMSLMWGMAGSFISLLMSRAIAKWSTGVQLVGPNDSHPDARWLVQTVHALSKKAGITTMPEVGIYPSPEINAFATGPTKNSALVAVSEGLLRNLSREEVEGVLGHEVSHAANGDMVTMTLVQGVVNSFVIFFSWILTTLIVRAMSSRDGDREDGGGYFIRHMINSLLQVLLGLLAVVLVIAPFSRWREFRADQGGSEKVGRHKMIAALEALKGGLRIKDPSAPDSLAAFKISGSWASLFSTHPPLDVRIARLKGQG